MPETDWIRESVERRCDATDRRVDRLEQRLNARPIQVENLFVLFVVIQGVLLGLVIGGVWLR
jgi:hypothetical protein